MGQLIVGFHHEEHKEHEEGLYIILFLCDLGVLRGLVNLQSKCF